MVFRSTSRCPARPVVLLMAQGPVIASASHTFPG